MKKIMIAACAVAVAAVAQAASIQWSASSYNYVTKEGTVQTAATATAGTFVLAYLGNDATNLKWDTATVANEGTVTYGSGKSGSYARAGGNYAFTYGAEGAPSNGDIYAVMFKGEDNKLYKLQYVNGDEVETTYTISGMSANNWSGNFTFATANYTAVPEPTSGLLLVLGMAGLALRRRRA